MKYFALFDREGGTCALITPCGDYLMRAMMSPDHHYAEVRYQGAPVSDPRAPTSVSGALQPLCGCPVCGRL